MSLRTRLLFVTVAAGILAALAPWALRPPSPQAST